MGEESWASSVRGGASLEMSVSRPDGQRRPGFLKRERTAFFATEGTRMKHGFGSLKSFSDPCSIRVSSVAKLLLDGGSDEHVRENCVCHYSGVAATVVKWSEIFDAAR